MTSSDLLLWLISPTSLSLDLYSLPASSPSLSPTLPAPRSTDSKSQGCSGGWAAQLCNTLPIKYQQNHSHDIRVSCITLWWGHVTCCHQPTVLTKRTEAVVNLSTGCCVCSFMIQRISVLGYGDVDDVSQESVIFKSASSAAHASTSGTSQPLLQLHLLLHNNR